MRVLWKWFALAPVVLGMAVVGSQVSRAQSADDTAITIVVPTEPDTLEPCESSNEAIGRIIKENINETLLDINPADGSLVPRLATSWEQIDPQTWRFKLVENAKFTDGEPFNADAVVFNITRAFNKDIQLRQISKAFAGFNLTAQEGRRVHGRHQGRQAGADPGHGLRRASPWRRPRSPATSTPGAQPGGPAPTSSSSGSPATRWCSSATRITGARSPRSARRPSCSGRNSAVRAAMSATGEADIAVAITEQDANNPATDFSYLDSETTWLRIDTRYAPMNDVRFRKALNYAVDREAMLGTVVSAEAIPAAQLPVPGINGHDPDLQALSL